MDLELARNGPALADRDRRRRDRLPRRLRPGERLAPFPRHLRGALAPGVPDLDAERSISEPFADLDHTRHCRFIVVVVEAAAGVGDAAFAYTNAFAAHVNVGFFLGATLPDPAGLLEGDGRYMRHVKLRPGTAVNSAALAGLIAAAYLDIRTRLESSQR